MQDHLGREIKEGDALFYGVNSQSSVVSRIGVVKSISAAGRPALITPDKITEWKNDPEGKVNQFGRPVYVTVIAPRLRVVSLKHPRCVILNGEGRLLVLENILKAATEVGDTEARRFIIDML